MKSRRLMCGWPPPGRGNFACRTEVACSHVSGLFRSPDGLLALMESANPGLITRADRCPNETAGFSRLRRIDRLCHHASLLSRKLQNVAQRPKPPRPRAGSSHAGASPPRRCARSCWLAPRRRPAAAAVDATRSPTDRHWSPSIAAN
jgi:hypothetical protein